MLLHRTQCPSPTNEVNSQTAHNITSQRHICGTRAAERLNNVQVAAGCLCVCVCVYVCVCVCVYVCYPLPATTAAPRARDISTGVALHFCSSDMLQVRIDVITQNTKCVCVGGSVCLVTCVSPFFRPEQNQLSRQFLQDVCGGKCN
jgi:hypothetical protein